MEKMSNVVEEGWILRDKSDELLEKLILIRTNLTESVHFIFEAHFPTLVKEFKEFFDFRFGQLMEYFVGLEILDLPNKVLSLDVEFGEILRRVSETVRVDEFWEGHLELLSSCSNLEVSLVLFILMVIENVTTVRSMLLFELLPSLCFFIILNLFVDMFYSLWYHFLFLFWHVSAK